MEESFYIYTWLKLVMLLSHVNGRQVLHIVFWILNLVISVSMLTAIIMCIFDRTERDEHNSYGVMYEIATYMPAVVSLMLSVVYAVIGTMLQIKLHGFFDFCTRPIISFLLATIIFIVASSFRFVGLFYSKWTGKHMRSSSFATFTYYLPDVLPALVILGLQIPMFLKIRRDALAEKISIIDSADNENYYSQ